MDDSHGGHEHDEGENRTHTRRNFLRRAGIAGAVAAGLAGGAELTGMAPAYARNRQARDRNPGQGSSRACTGCAYSCNYTPGKCGSIGPCGTGGCCFTCTGSCGTLLQCHPCSDRPSYSLCIG